MKQCRDGLAGVFAVFIVFACLTMAGCGGGSNGGAGSSIGKTSIHITDSPSLTYDHVWITVTEAWFHKLDVNDPADPGWIKFPLAVPRTIDLARLTAGATQEVWSGLSLPPGTYRQIRVFLASTDTAPLPTLPAGVTFNNQVDYTDSTGSHKAPLHIPAPGQGIKVIPDTPIEVTPGTALRLALDFNPEEDVVEVFRQGQLSSARPDRPSSARAFVLKGNLSYFDMNSAAAISGTLAPPSGTFANYTGKNIMVKAEIPNTVTGYREVRRSTTIDSGGRYVLYPLPLFGNATTARYDLVVSGRNVETVIITGVRVRRGTLPTTATAVSSQAVTLTTNTSRFPIQVRVKPAGAWVDFYQTLPGDTIPYQIFRGHINPFDPNGGFPAPILLSAGPLRVGAWNNGGAITLNPVTPAEGAGGYKAIASAVLFNPSQPMSVSSLTPLLTFSPLAITSPASPKTITGNIKVTPTNLNRGSMLITSGGILVDSLDLSDRLKPGDNPYMTGNLPGGSFETPFPGAFYDLYVLGWNEAQPDQTVITGSAPGVNLQTTNGMADVIMRK